jgi:hypothetical protein
MATGLILLGFIAIVLTVVTAKVRARIGFPVQPGFYPVALAGITIVALILWATHKA